MLHFRIEFTSQVFDVRPTPRKWLSLEKTPHSEKRFTKHGAILVMASANVGRSLVTSTVHEGSLISHHFMRIEPHNAADRGWIYAFLRSRQGLAMMSGSQYASVIRHIEPPHLKSLPIPDVDEVAVADFERRVIRMLALRDQSYQHTLEAERLFGEALGPVSFGANEAGFVGRLSQFAGGRRRFEANFHAPQVAAILARIEGIGAVETVGEVTKRVWWPNRFRRVYGEQGIPFLSANELFSINPTGIKRILVDQISDDEDLEVKAKWVVMARSGQVYGLNGSAMLMTSEHERQILSDDLIRIIPDESKIRPGYLLTALTHPTLGRPMVIRNAYGTSIPHLDPADVSGIPAVRFSDAVEAAIADHAEASAKARAEADALDRELVEDAGRLIDEFIAGGKLGRMNNTLRLRDNAARPVPLVEHARVRLRESLPEHHLRAGTTGTIVHVYTRKEGLEVEFGANSKTPKVVTLTREAVEPAND